MFSRGKTYSLNYIKKRKDVFFYAEKQKKAHRKNVRCYNGYTHGVQFNGSDYQLSG